MPADTSKDAAEQHAKFLENYWRDRGSSEIKVWVIRRYDTWQIKSNLRNGFPPDLTDLPAERPVNNDNPTWLRDDSGWLTK